MYFSLSPWHGFPRKWSVSRECRQSLIATRQFKFRLPERVGGRWRPTETACYDRGIFQCSRFVARFYTVWGSFWDQGIQRTGDTTCIKYLKMRSKSTNSPTSFELVTSGTPFTIRSVNSLSVCFLIHTEGNVVLRDRVNTDRPNARASGSFIFAITKGANDLFIPQLVLYNSLVSNGYLRYRSAARHAFLACKL